MNTITNLKNAITTQSELELISKEIWFMNFTKLGSEGGLFIAIGKKKQILLFFKLLSNNDIWKNL